MAINLIIEKHPNTMGKQPKKTYLKFELDWMALKFKKLSRWIGEGI